MKIGAYRMRVYGVLNKSFHTMGLLVYMGQMVLLLIFSNSSLQVPLDVLLVQFHILDASSMALILVIRSLKSTPMVLIVLAQVQILSAAPMVLLRIMVALLGIVLVLIRILRAFPMALLLISQSS